MSTLVGTKGQVTIEKAIRDALGVQPGWRAIQRLEDGRSIMDAVLGPAKHLESRLSAPDRERLDQYFSAVREVEQRLVNNQEWATKPKPAVDYKPPKDIADPNDDVGRLALLLDLVQLALATDSTRFITLYVTGSNAVQPTAGGDFGLRASGGAYAPSQSGSTQASSSQ